MRGASRWIAMALVCAACGGARPIAEDTSSTAEARRRSRERATRGSDEEGSPRRHEGAAAAEADEADLPLDPPQVVAGTGVTVRPPRGSERASIRSTFLHPRRRLQIVVWAAEGDLAAHQQLREALSGEAEQLEAEDVEIDGTTASCIVDRQAQGDAELERVWVLARRGTRSVAAMGVYASQRTDALRALVRASVMSVHFDDHAPIDPEAALGWRLAPGAGLTLVRSSSTNLNYTPDGQAPEPGELAPVLFLQPLPIQVPESERGAMCTEILGQLVPIPPEVAVERGTIDAGPVTGCDMSASTRSEPRLSAYWALVFRDAGTFLVGGTVEEAQRATWIARFRSAARTVEPSPDPAE